MVDTKKHIKFTICVKLWQHNLTIATVVKLLTKGLCSESGLHSLPFRSSRCPRLRVHSYRFLEALPATGLLLTIWHFGTCGSKTK